MTSEAPEEASLAADTLDVIERETAVLTRHLELLRRRSDSYAELDRAEYLLLRTLDLKGSVDINTLACAIGVDPSTAGRQIASMERNGLVERSPAATDRRRSIITPTATGRRRMAAVRARRHHNVAELLSDWNDADLRTLGGMLERYNRAVAKRYLPA